MCNYTTVKMPSTKKSQRKKQRISPASRSGEKVWKNRRSLGKKKRVTALKRNLTHMLNEKSVRVSNIETPEQNGVKMCRNKRQRARSLKRYLKFIGDKRNDNFEQNVELSKLEGTSKIIKSQQKPDHARIPQSHINGPLLPSYIKDIMSKEFVVHNEFADSNNIKKTLLDATSDNNNGTKEKVTSNIRSYENNIQLDNLSLTDISNITLDMSNDVNMLNNDDVFQENNSDAVNTPVNHSSKISIIEIKDTPKTSEKFPYLTVFDESMICEDLCSSDSDNDVIFVSRKRKSLSKTDIHEKHCKLDESVIVIEDDIPENMQTNNTHGKENIPLPAIKPRNEHYYSDNPLIITETVHRTCRCQGLTHSCLVKPNLATIPEEFSHNFCSVESKNSEVNKNNTHFHVQQNLRQSLTQYDDHLRVFGNNFLNGGSIRTVGLRPVFIDGCNVAFGHSNGRYFSVKGLKICIDYFKLRGHEVTAIVPMIRKRNGENSDPKLLKQLEEQGTVVFTPSRKINGKNIIPYDDRFLVLMAAVHQGIIVSCDNFRDLLAENPHLSETIHYRVLNPTWMKDMLMFPSDPLGRYGPTLEVFLRFP